MAVSSVEARTMQFDRAPMGSRGYQEADVDHFLDRVADTLEGNDDLTADQVHRVAFNKAPLGKRGYDQVAVDAFLRLVEGTLAVHGGASEMHLAPALEHTHTRKPLWRRRGL